MFHNNLRMKLHTIIRQLRQSRGWSQEQLAELCGITTVSVSRIETGRQGVSSRLLEILAKQFDLEPHQLMALAEGAIPYNSSAAPDSDEEKRLLDSYRRLSVENRALFLKLCDALASTEVTTFQ